MSSGLTHSAADILGEFLSQQGKLTGYTLRINGSTSDVGDKLIAISDTEATGTTKAMTGAVVEYPGIQIRVRGVPDDQLGPRTALNTIGGFLDLAVRQTLSYSGSAYTIHGVHRTSGILPMLADEQRRWEWTWNATIVLTQTS